MSVSQKIIIYFFVRCILNLYYNISHLDLDFGEFGNISLSHNCILKYNQ